MIFTTLVSVLAIPALVSAQIYGPPPSSGTTTSAAPASAPSAPPDTQGQMNINVAFNGTSSLGKFGGCQRTQVLTPLHLGNFVFNPANITAPVSCFISLVGHVAEITLGWNTCDVLVSGVCYSVHKFET